MNELPRGWIAAQLYECASFNPRHPADADRSVEVSFVPMPAVSEVSGTIEGGETRRLSEVWTGYTHFQNGDVIFAKITPCMENGKIAVARHLHNGLACGSTEFHVLRPHDGVLADYLWRYLRQNSFRRDAEQSMTGAVGQRRVPADFLRSTVRPLSPSDEQRRIVAKIDSLSAKSKRARGQLDHIPRLVEKYKQAILAAAFRGNLTHEWRMKRQKSVPLKAFNEPNRQKKPTQHEDFVAPYEVPDGWTACSSSNWRH
jgi:type I restriction enzyme, S subunit